uniref:Dachsous-like protein n=1 Tax=Tritia obsoleta TaxID=1934733 RepID=A0A8F4YKB5_9CAEN|nr:dachsous-like protein [Tritia obsoleta]
MLVPDPVYIAQAWDIDSGSNGSLTYRLQPDQDYDHLFQIDRVTGEVFLRGSLDYEQRQAYELVVVAEDQGTGSGGHLSASMTLTVNVKDVNDNRPVFSRQVYDFYVSEDEPIGFKFGNVTALDADSEHNGRVSYSLQESRYLSVFTIFTVQGVLSTRQRLDRESQDLYTLTVVATDHGTPQPLSATASIRVHVRDTNDNDPEFSRAEYKFSIPENRPRGTRIGQVTASDRDDGENQRLQYRFSGNYTKFAINTYSGDITTLKVLDREEQDEYSLKVYVMDSGVPERRDSAVVKIAVLDENDNSPGFQGGEDSYEVEVFENRPKGLQVKKVVAQDPDAGENGTVTFAFDPDESDSEALANFNIHPTSGWISTEEVLDFETRTQYRLQVLAYDSGNPRRFQTQTVVIKVRDVNDESPLFHAREVNFYVVENVAIGTVVGEVQAQDRDSGENGRVNYYLVGGNVFSLFSVHTATGVIRTVREIDYEESSSHVLSIQAVDSNAAFPRSSNISVLVHVMDINDNPPSFDIDPVFPKVRENSGLGHVVHTFVATDRDSGLNGTVRYSVASESAAGPAVNAGNYFYIDPESGQLSVAKDIDYEQVHTVTIIIKAEDRCPVDSLVLFSQVTVEVSVVDVNDNRPVFESRSEVHIFEDEPIGYPAIFIVAADRDSNQDDSGNNVVSYTIVSGNEDGKFRLEQSSGLLTIYEALDRETRASYSLNVSAEDAGVPKQVSFQQLWVTVVDVNDNAPRFLQSLYTGRVFESTSDNEGQGQPAVSTLVATVKANDRDEGKIETR